jgi:DNA-binding transcriptional LysR family regulator
MDIDREWLNEVKTFSVVSEKLSFSQAAETLGITSSAVSKIISRMEHRLRTKLFLRTTRAVQVSEVGSLYLTRSREILADIQSLESEIEHEQQDLRGTLRVSAPLMLGHAHVLPVALQFQALYADVRLELDLTDRVTDILEERIDVAIRMIASPPEAFVAKKLCHDERVLCASSEYLNKHGIPKNPKDLSEHYGVLFCKADVPVPWLLFRTKSDSTSRPFLPKARLHVSSVMAAHAAAKSNLGIANLPKYLAVEDFKCKKLVPLLSDYVHSPRSVWAIYSGSRTIPRKLKVFVEMLKQHFEGI